MELFLLFLLGCFVVGMTVGGMDTKRQAWVVFICVVIMTTLYFVSPGLL